MCSIYDYLKEESIICFKPDIKRGKFKQFNMELVESDNELVLLNGHLHSVPIDIIENTMSEDLSESVLKMLRSVFSPEVDSIVTSQYACAIRVFCHCIH